MTSFIGLPGALAEIACPSREDVTTDRAVSELVPFSGERIVQLGRRTRRSWSIDWGAEHPRDYAVLDALARWESPLVWVGALAQATNLLTPEQATLQAAKYGGSGHRNLAQNPRFHTLDRQLGTGTASPGANATLDLVDGGGVRVSGGDNYYSSVYLTITNHPIGALAGKTVTISASITMTEPMTDTSDQPYYTPRAIILSVGGAGAGDFVAASPSAPNEPGTHRVSVTYTLPDDPEEGWTVRLFKGDKETSVIWDQVVIEEGATSGVWFDGSAAGARTGLMNVDGMPVVTWAGGPIGGQINVTGDQPVPVIPGTPVTVSVWGKRAGQRTSARLSYWFRDVTGAQVEAATLSGSSSDDLVRRSWTLTPPPGAATLSVLIRDAAILALPQVTWTDGPVDWAPGRGVHRVVVVPGSESPIVAHRRQVLTGAAYTILEVG